MDSSAYHIPDQLDAEIFRAVSGLPGAHADDWHRLKGGRCNHVWRSGDVVVKIYQAAMATPLFPNDSALEAAALHSLAPRGLAPEPLARGPNWLAWRHVAGSSWQGEAGIAALLQALSHVPPFAGLTMRPMGAWAIAAQAQSFAPPGMPALPRLVEVALPKPSLLHGDLVPGNILCTAKGFCLIDWQCPGLGDPVDDLALFLSPAMQWLYRGKAFDVVERRALLDQLPEDLRHRYHLLAPVLHWRIAAHCAYRAQRGDADYDVALRLELAALQIS